MSDYNLDRALSAIMGQPPEIRAAAASALVSRMAFARQHGITFDGRRDLYESLGYARVLSVLMMRARYERGGLAKRVVTAPVKATWRGGLQLEENDDPKIETNFERDFRLLWQRLRLREKFERVDRLSRVGEYAVLLLHDGQADLKQPLKKSTGPDALLAVRPIMGAGGPDSNGQNTSWNADVVTADIVGTISGVTIKAYDTKPTSARYGKPEMYQLVGGQHAAAGASKLSTQSEIHWSRCIHVAEELSDNDVYGTPALLDVWNLFDDLEKISGGGAEAFYQRANQGRVWTVDQDTALTAPEAADFKDQIDQFVNGMVRDIRLRNVDVKTLGSDVAQFGSNADAIIKQIAGTKGIPLRILTGSEMGELASSQDRDNWRDQVNGRREEHAYPNIVYSFVEHLISYGYMAAPADLTAITPKWGVVMALTEEEKRQGAQAWASMKVGGRPVFTEEEIRAKWYDMAPLTPAEKKAIAPEPPKFVAAPFGRAARRTLQAPRLLANNHALTLADTHEAHMLDVLSSIFDAIPSIESEVSANVAADAMLERLRDVLPELLFAAADDAGRVEVELLPADSTGTLSALLGRVLRKPSASAKRFEFGSSQAQQWAEEHAAELVTNIDETTRDSIRFIVARRLDGTITDAEYARELRKAVGDAERADLIARTESMLAVNNGRRLAWKQAAKAGILPKTARRTWIATGDESTCKICGPLSGETARLNGTYPGGIAGPPAHPRCRCTEGLSL